ncbi:D-alanyl-D-alanine carboxypeptidase/D-alanyl-D-alanine endopeptidase [Sulfitobacter guttiformis]|uniref:D-alanyl-D-alanine carboxypeptidase/D-alanyl-D-alanine-endopeptidase (Penicillin-binding protein 4) n=1 Tax=Sulfitobacter guttiformis TaxID=74349 RepID=A0A420DT49_9RHOB|nr:D-alanyl-D-alanine carboxypeptidase/D-alanyl-D-alanine-endopeptidase [Sulfitobacter guttiformis]KIN74900.1 D-alanyl-D-alanine carboxypeptidase/D-alanyl-D-alanine-endopeptidase [Sulfitobacter guttiformis KCTC 32187]RKE97466.1 D-alanyl-D-alanine carboxypeptidase/D-alanyl-D-alanine-endopeptidase (penicillin-binding protein 4) [Sulfitobacter guttiformis]
MERAFSRRYFLGTAAAAAVLGSHTAQAAPPTESLRPVQRGEAFFKRAARSVEDILGEAKLAGNVSFAVSDAATGKTLETHDAAIARPPASVTKAITALYALDALGAGHRFETRLLATGGVVNGEIGGDLVLVGGGDPTLDTDTLALMAANLKAAGIIGVKGGFKVYEASLPVISRIDPEQPDQVGYNPGVSGIALNYNRVHFEWRRASGNYTVTMEGRSDKYRPAVTMAVMQIRDRAAPVYTYEDKAGIDAWSVARGALGGSGSRWLPVRKPGLYAGEVFQTLAGAHGIRLSAPKIVDVVPEAEILVRQESEDLRSILRDMLKWSTNLTAEMMGLAASAAHGPVPVSLKASASQMNIWARANLGMTGPALVDHSGLGDDSRLTANDMVAALVHARNEGLRDILKPVKMRDEKRKVVDDHPIKVDAKTGTLNFVSALAGYLTGPDGTEMAFAIFAADQDIRAKLTRAEREGPPGSDSWNIRAKRMQQHLIERWGVLYGA